MIQSCIALCCLEQLLSSHKGHPRICHITKIYDPYAILRMLEFFGLTKSMHDGIIRGPYVKTPLFDRVFKFTPAAPFDPMVRIKNHTQDPAHQKELANLYRQLNETRGLR